MNLQESFAFSDLQRQREFQREKTIINAEADQIEAERRRRLAEEDAIAAAEQRRLKEERDRIEFEEFKRKLQQGLAPLPPRREALLIPYSGPDWAPKQPRVDWGPLAPSRTMAPVRIVDNYPYDNRPILDRSSSTPEERRQKLAYVNAVYNSDTGAPANYN